MTNAPIPTENLKNNWQHKNATKHFDYTTIADRLRTVISNNNNHLVRFNQFTGAQNSHLP